MIKVFGFQISDDLRFWISYFKRFQISAYLRLQILDFKFWISDFRFQILDFRFWILDFRFQLSDSFQMSDFRFRFRI